MLTELKIYHRSLYIKHKFTQFLVEGQEVGQNSFWNAFLDCFKERDNSGKSDILARKRPLTPREISHDWQKHNVVPREGWEKALVLDSHASPEIY